MRNSIESLTFEASELHDELPAKICFLSADPSWAAKKILELRAAKITNKLYVEEYSDAIVSPVFQGSSSQEQAGGVYSNDGFQIPLARILHREQIVFGGAERIHDRQCEFEIEEGIWAGKMTAHFGHFITEGIARLHAAWSNNLPILYSAKFSAHSPHSQTQMRSWMRDALQLIGIDPQRLVFVERNTRVRRLIIPSPGLELGRSFDLSFIRALRVRVERALTSALELSRDREERVFLSRSRLDVGRIAIGEIPLQGALDEKGWKIVHPEELDFGNQILEVSTASSVAGLYGSQMHTLLFRPEHRSFDLVFLASAYFNVTYAHTELITPGTKIIAKCDNYRGLPVFGNATPYTIDLSVVRQAFEKIDVSLDLKEESQSDYLGVWSNSLSYVCTKKGLPPERIERVIARVPPELRARFDLDKFLDERKSSISKSPSIPEHHMLIIGQSHTEAVSAAEIGRGDLHLEIVNLNARDRNMSVSDKIKVGNYIPRPGAHKLYVSMMGGNFYNTFGLIESTLPFDFVEPDMPGFSLQEGRRLISYELLYCYFSDVMRKGFLRSILSLRDYYGDPFVHVISPPPIGDDRHIADNPGGYFSDKIHLGVAPASLRGKLYRLHTRVVVEFCRENGIPTLPPPSEAVTEEGFLARPFWKNDPTHANAAYGRLVLEQLRGYRP